jgi:hypothetical protein
MRISMAGDLLSGADLAAPADTIALDVRNRRLSFRQGAREVAWLDLPQDWNPEAGEVAVIDGLTVLVKFTVSSK